MSEHGTRRGAPGFTRGRGRWGLGLAAWLALPAAALAQDSDADGVQDAADAFPCDVSRASVSYFPGQSTSALLAFEDQWPSHTDVDFNDVAVRVHYRLERNAAGNVVQLVAVIDPVALGGDFSNGLGLVLPASRAGVTVRRRVGGGAWQPVSLESDANATMLLSGNLRELFGNASGRINSRPNEARQGGQRLEVEVTFATPAAISQAAAPFDLFVFRSGNPGHQIHLPQYAGTAAMNAALFNSDQDGSTANRRFVHVSGVPAALNLMTSTRYPLEGVGIGALFPDIAGFAASGGAQNASFYSTNVVSAQGHDVAALALPAVAAPDQACAARTSCRAHLEAGSAVSGTYTIDPDGSGPVPARSVYCDMSQGYTFTVGSVVQNAPSSIPGGCPAGFSPFAVQSAAHAAALEAYVATLSSNGSHYYANVYAGPGFCSSGSQVQVGWLDSTGAWIDAAIDEATLAPLNLSSNCNQTLMDPVPLRDSVGFANRSCAACLYNSTEVVETGAVICSTNDVAVARPASCAAVWASGVRVNGLHMIDPDGLGGAAAFEVRCDFSTGLTLFRGASVENSFASISGGCPAGSEVFSARSAAHVAHLDDHVRASAADGTWLYANVFTGPGQCPTTATQLGWMGDATTWNDSAYDESFGGPTITNNCNGGGQYDPVTMQSGVGFATRGGCTLCLWNRTESLETGRAVCAVRAAASATSCRALYQGGARADGFYAIDPDGAGPAETWTVWCDMTRGGMTLTRGGRVRANHASIVAGCPAGLAPFQVRSAAHAAALEAWVTTRPRRGDWYYANVFSGPGLCPTTAAQVGWLSAANTWVDGAIDEATLAPMVLTGNCNGGNLYDPVPLNETDGFNNRGATGYLYNSSEQPHTGYAVCSTNGF